MLLVSEPSLGEGEKSALAAVIDSNWITMGGLVQAFEREFADMHRAADAVAVNSCTAGLHLALEALGIGRGDEVLVPSLSFVATANCVLYSGAAPVFVDIESPDVPLICSVDAAAKCTSRTRAVIVMHYGGYLADADAWRSFAASRGLFLIEDSAHAVGTGRGEVFADAAAFSFFGNKNMTTAEGGMVLARDPKVLRRVRQARSHGMTSSTVQRLNGQKADYDVTMCGYNYRMTELSAAIGMVQLRQLDLWNGKRAALAQHYRDMLKEYCPEVRVPFPQPRLSTHHIMPVLLPSGADRQSVIDAMREEGVQTSFHYPPIHKLSLYWERCPSLPLPRTEAFASRELTVPLHPKMEKDQVALVVSSLARALKQNRAPERSLWRSAAE